MIRGKSETDNYNWAIEKSKISKTSVLQLVGGNNIKFYSKFPFQLFHWYKFKLKAGSNIFLDKMLHSYFYPFYSNELIFFFTYRNLSYLHWLACYANTLWKQPKNSPKVPYKRDTKHTKILFKDTYEIYTTWLILNKDIHYLYKPHKYTSPKFLCGLGSNFQNLYTRYGQMGNTVNLIKRRLGPSMFKFRSVNNQIYPDYISHITNNSNVVYYLLEDCKTWKLCLIVVKRYHANISM